MRLKMPEHNALFVDKLLKEKLSLDKFNIPDIDGKIKIISGWAKEIEKKEIYNKKEEQLQSDFLNDLFGKVLDYAYQRGLDEYNLEKEEKSKTDSTKPDGVLGYLTSTNKDIRVVIELKDAYTNLDHKQNRKNDNRTPVEQAFSYVSKSGGNCKWVIVSNFIEIRLYPSNDSSVYQKFMVKDLIKPDVLKTFYALLAKDRLFCQKTESIIDKLLKNKIESDTKITKRFYEDYKKYRTILFNHIKENNPNINDNIILEKSQKILDRIIFICFCEDIGLLPYKVFKQILEEAKSARFDTRETKLWERTKALFKMIDKGYPSEHINRFNGGLFKEDSVIDNLVIKDSVLEGIISLETYDFESDLNVNILGHIFEQSITDLEEIKASFNGEEVDKKKGKRKKDGIFYTPEYITRYIVDEAVGGWLEDKKKELGYYNLPKFSGDEQVNLKTGKIKKTNKKVKAHLDFWLKFRKELNNITVLDCACGSGSFLVQVFDYLKEQSRLVNEEIANLEGQQSDLFNYDKHILSHNIFGVDLNAESVEITKLALWLKTANKKDPLTSLDNNIRCGNSLVDDPEIDSKHAFDWNKEFPEIMSKGGFDVIVGNPPYVSIELIPQKDKDYYKSTYKSFFKRSDLFSLFLELANNKLSNGGYVSFIIPSVVLNNISYQKIRDEILNNHRLMTVCYTGGNVFSDAVVDTTILVLGQNHSNKINLIDARNFTNKKYASVAVDYFKKYNNKISIGNSCIDTICDKIFNQKYETVGNNFRVFQGIVTGKNKAFIFDNEADAISKGIDKELLHPLTLGKDVCKWGIKNSKRVILYLDSGTELHNYPKIEKWLNNFKKDLSNRREAKNGTIPWYSLQWSRDKKNLDIKEKILIQTTRNESLKTRIVATLDDTSIYSTQGCNIIIPQENSKYSLYFLIGLLNSKLVNYLFLKMFLNLDIKADYIKSIKFPKIKDDKIALLSKTILIKNKELQDLSDKFYTLLSGDFKDITINSSLINWYDLDWGAFTDILKKQKINLTGTLKEDWYDRFNRLSQEAKSLKSIIDGTDKKIDSLVYELYGLTKDEIAEIEKK